MPDYVGRTRNSAVAELQSFNVSIAEKSEISNKPAGTVLRQDPQAGDPYPTAATLWIAAAPLPVPDVVGKTIGEAKTQLEGLGFTVVEEGALAEGKPDGTVVSQDPAAGANNVAEVKLGVARKPELSYLADWTLLTDPYYCDVLTEAREGNGELYSRPVAVKCGSSAHGVAELEYDLSRDYQRLSGKMSLSNESNTEGVAKLEVYGDDRLLTTEQVKFGKTVNFKAEVTDVLRLKLRISFSDRDVMVVLGDPTLEGFPEKPTNPSTTG